MKIRKVSIDLKEVGKLMLKEFSKPPFNERDSLDAVLKSLKFYYKKGQVYVAEIEKVIVGILVFQIEQWWEGSIIIIQDLAIEDKFQKQNIGKELMEFLEKYAKENRVKRIYFETNKKSSAIKFYQKLGYQINKDRISMNKKLK